MTEVEAGSLNEVDVEAWVMLATLAALEAATDEVSRGYIRHTISAALDDQTVKALDLLVVNGLIMETEEGEWAITGRGRVAFHRLEQLTEQVLLASGGADTLPVFA